MRARACLSAALLCLVATLARPGVTWAQMPGGAPHTTTMDMDRLTRVFVLADLLEYVPAGTGAIRADGLAWIGGDFNRLYLRLDATQPFQGSGGDMEVDVTYGRLVTPFWTALVGGRAEVRGLGSSERRSRTLLAFGFQGIAPYWFEMEPTFYVSSKGQVSGRFASSVDLYFTQRLILQPRVESHYAVQAVRELRIGSGVNDIELGARMRYEFRREFAPYVGLTWFRRTGERAGMARAVGEAVGQAGLVAGVRMWR